MKTAKRLGFSFVTMTLLVLAFALTSVNTQAGPLLNVPVTIEQPDGTTLNAFVSGDEFFNYLHDDEGRIIVQHPETGFWVYAALDTNGELNASSRVAVNSGRFYDTDNRARGIQPISSYGITTTDIDFVINAHLVRDMDMPTMNMATNIAPHGAQQINPAGFGMVRANPISGVMENIVILIAFACDHNPAISPVLYNTVQSRFNGHQGSLRSYMYAASGGALTLNSTLVGVDNNTAIMYQDIMPRGYFMPFNEVTNPIGFVTNAQENSRGQALLARAVNAIDGSTLLDGKVLDTLIPGRVDSVTFILTGQPGAWASFLWPHSWALHMQFATLGGARVWDYSLVLIGSMDVSLIIHEQLHVFGAPDFYRYISATRPPGPVGTPVGFWDIMSHNSDAFLAFSNTHIMRRYFGWGDAPAEIAAGGRFTLYPRGTPGRTTAFTIPIEGRPNEFILLEYRSHLNPTAYDNFFETSSFNRAGLLIKRINTDFVGNARSGDPAFQNGYTGFRDEVYIFRPSSTARNAALSDVTFASFSANGGRTRFGNARGTGYNGIIYSHEGYNTGIEIYNVSAAGGTISFNVYLGRSAIVPQSPEMLLRAAVANAGSEPLVIELEEDITLADIQSYLLIPSGSHITIRGAGGVMRTLSAGGNFSVINVQPGAVLVLDDMRIARVARSTGHGVSNSGYLTLLGGVISGHTGAGVSNMGTFVMEGGQISSNTSSGVSNLGTFLMRGGNISSNSANIGGGVNNSGTFTIEGGEITSNFAGNRGGGVNNSGSFIIKNGIISYNITFDNGAGVANGPSGNFIMRSGYIHANISMGNGGGLFTWGTFYMEGGQISGNSAFNGGGIGVNLADLRRGIIHIGADAVFMGNIAGNARHRDIIDDALYNQNIHGTQWTDPFTQGFNNIDIAYTAGSIATIRSLSFELSPTVINPTEPLHIDPIRVIANTPLTQAPQFPNDPSRTGYTFAGWYLNAGFTQAVTDATMMPNNDTTILYARWEKPLTITGVVVSPLTVIVRQGETRTFTAAVTGTNNPAQTVTWAVEGNNSAVTLISATGILTVAADETAISLTIRATSTADTGISGTATVTVTQLISIDRTGLNATILEAQVLNPAGFNIFTWLDMYDELRRALLVYNNQNATQAQIDAAKARLRTAIDALAVPSGPDRSALNAAIADAESREMQNYFIFAWFDLQDELVRARIVRDNPSANQTQINHATARLVAAINAL